MALSESYCGIKCVYVIAAFIVVIYLRIMIHRGRNNTQFLAHRLRSVYTCSGDTDAFAAYGVFSVRVKSTFD